MCLDYVGLLNRCYFLSSQDYCEVWADYCDIFPSSFTKQLHWQDVYSVIFPWVFWESEHYTDLLLAPPGLAPVECHNMKALYSRPWLFPSSLEVCSFLPSFASTLKSVISPRFHFPNYLYPFLIFPQPKYDSQLSFQLFNFMSVFLSSLTQKSLFNKYHRNS